MKANKIVIAALALAALAACSKENQTGDNGFAGKGDQAYLAVEVVSSNSEAFTKANGTTTEDKFYYGTAEENVVSSADFFFYKEDGAFFSHVSQSIDGNAKTGEGYDNVSWVGNGIVILKGLTSKSSPAYMSVILNDNALAAELDGKSLSEAQKKTATKIAATGTSTAYTNFVMSSSSYNNGNAASGYFCTKLTASMFKDTEAAAQAASASDKAVAYVERLAAKIQLSLGTALGTGDKIDLGEFKVGPDNIHLYAKIGKWGINATTKETYTYKAIDTAWDFGTFSWNDSGNYRSYWAKSPNYGVESSVYADSYNNSEATPANNYKGNETKQALGYISYNDCGVALAQTAYCRENTNTEGELRANNHNTTATCALLTAQIIDGSDNANSLVNYENQLWTVDQYKTRVLARFSGIAADTYIPWLSNDGTNFTQITTANFEEVNAGDGLVYLKIAAAPAGYTYYLKDAAAASGYTATTVDDLNTSVWKRDMSECAYFKDGMMYYSIPVEHIRKTGTFADNDYKEADYGVVRNHWYRITVNSVKNLGTAVYDPAEAILPNDANTKKYYVGAQVNILSWKVVNQTVDL